jgi:thiamine monophosphate synthase
MEALLSSLAPPASLLALAQEWRQLASHEIPTFAVGGYEASN